MVDDRLRWFHWHCYVTASPADRAPAPAPADRRERLARKPDRVLRSPVSVAEWITEVSYDQGKHFAVWLPLVGKWQEFTAPDQADLRLEYIQLAGRAQSVYMRVRGADGIELQVSAEAVDAESCHQINEHQAGT